MLIRLGEIIKDAREYKEVTQAELADFAFVSVEKVKKIEENHTVPDFDTALLICNFLDIEVIEKGVDVNLQSEEGYTALMWAAQEGHPGVARLLIHAGADVNVQNNDGWIALMHASIFGYTEVAELLIDAGADVNVRTPGSTISPPTILLSKLPVLIRQFSRGRNGRAISQ